MTDGICTLTGLLAIEATRRPLKNKVSFKKIGSLETKITIQDWNSDKNIEIEDIFEL